jgi:glycosyltransferase involved in cell wall biosynthesis
MLSVICPIYNEEKYIGSFLESILKQDYPKEDLEILLVDGMSKDKTRDIIANYAEKYPCLRLVDNPQQTVPYAMNNGIKCAKGDIIIRLDAHAEYPSNYFSVLAKKLNELEGADNVGGVCITLPCNDTSVAVSIAECLSNKFGMGNSYFRVGAKGVMSVDTVPFGCFRKSLFDKIGFYDTDMIRNQDDELNGRIIKNGGKIYLLPDVEIKYFARDKISKVRKMFYQYGLYKPLGNKKLGAPATIRQFFPLLFVLFLVIGLIGSILFPIVLPIYLGVIVLHLAIGAYEGLKSAQKTNRGGCCLIMPYIFLNMHICYGLGYLRGMYNLALHKSFEAKSNH